MPRDTKQNTGGVSFWPAPPGKTQSLGTQWAVTDHTGAPPSYLYKP